MIRLGADNNKEDMMKKIIGILAATAALAACEGMDLSQLTTASASDPVKTRLRACILNEATAKAQAGTLLASGLSATADEISTTCIKKLALQSAGLDGEATSTATSILNNLMNGTAAK